MEICAWLVLRIVYAWMFISPLPALLKDWGGTKDMTRLLIPNIATTFLTIIMLCVMFFGALSILFGVLGQIAGLALCIYCLLGAVVHSRLARSTNAISLSSAVSIEDQQKLGKVIKLAVVGNMTSAYKNIVLAAVGFFFMLMGTGPISLLNVHFI
jgi:uncharacterized membrane protein YphA (DoxX/SURF4 family)